MKSEPVPDADNVVRYIKPTAIDDGEINGSGFELKSDHKGVSVNWLECFGELGKAGQLAQVRKRGRLGWKASGCLAELNVGRTKEHLLTADIQLSFMQDPLEPEGEYEDDPSHSLICGIPVDPPEHKELVQDMIADSVSEIHSAIIDE